MGARCSRLGDARMWAGIHFRSDVEAGRAIGDPAFAKAFAGRWRQIARVRASGGGTRNAINLSFQVKGEPFGGHAVC